jgi:putative peptide zinc metalloprotease protein
LTLTAIGLAAVVLGILAIPLPHYVNCVCYVQPQAVEYVYVEIPGSLAEILVQPGQRVVAGDPLAKLVSPEIEDRILQMERAEKIAEAQVQVVNYLVRNEPLASGEVNPAEAENAWRVAQSKLKQRRRDLERLEIVAPRTGTFLPAAPRTKNDQADEVGQLRTWQKTPLDSQNLGAWLESQTLLGQIVPHDGRFEAILAIDQADVEFIRSGQVVKLWLRQLPGKNLRAETTQISPTKMKAVPRQLSIHTGGDLPTVRTEQGIEEPANPTFQVAVPLREEIPHLLSGAVGIAKVHVGSQTLGGRLWRLACQTFRLEM